MITNIFNLIAVSESCFAGKTSKTGFVALMLITLILFLPSLSQADGLFDFQMKLAKKGNAEAEYKVGEMYETGFGVKKDMNEAKNWITKSASQGHETAKFKLLYWDIEKNGITKENKAEVDVLVAKAEDGNPQAQFYVGKMHANGVGVKKNSDVAIVWLNKAALVGVLAAENELITVREAQQRQVLAREKSRSRADEKNRAELKVKQEQEKQAQLEKQRKSQAKKNARNDDIAKKNKAEADARLAAEKKAEQQAKIIAQAEATARKREAQKQALLKKRAVDEKKRKIQFESDPCSGKSARFLSTCR